MTRDQHAEVRAERLVDEDRELYESFRDLGMSPAAALSATAGRDGHLQSVSGFDRLTESFEALGLSPNAARTAAIGRGREREVREALDRPATTRRPLDHARGGEPLAELLRDSGFSEQEVQRIAGVEGDRPGGLLRESASGFRQRTLSLAERVHALEHGPRRLAFLDALREADAELREEARYGA